MASGGPGFAAALCVMMLPEGACALPAPQTNFTPFTPLARVELQSGLPQVELSNPAFGFEADNGAAIGDFLTLSPRISEFALPNYPYLTVAAFLSDDTRAPSFDIGGYDAMWDDTLFSEISAYGGLGRDALRVAGMESMNGVYSTSGTIPYGRLTVQRQFLSGQHTLAVGAYGLHLSVRPTAISGFGDDSYTDVAVDGTYRWILHPERDVSDTISAHVLILHEGEDLIASHAVFDTNRNDEIRIFRSELSYGWGEELTPGIQYFQIAGTSDPVYLGTPDGSPDSKGWIAEMGIASWSGADSPLARLHVRVALQFISYSEFDGSSRNASANNTVLLRISAGGD